MNNMAVGKLKAKIKTEIKKEDICKTLFRYRKSQRVARIFLEWLKSHEAIAKWLNSI